MWPFKNRSRWRIEIREDFMWPWIAVIHDGRNHTLWVAHGNTAGEAELEAQKYILDALKSEEAYKNRIIVRH